jgi:hypothetical protein
MSRDSTATVDREKGIIDHSDTHRDSENFVSSPETLAEWNAMSSEDQRKFERKLLWKLDFRLVPWLSLLYLLSFLDRTNIGNAKIQGV